MPIGPRRGSVPCAATTGSLSARAGTIVSERAPTPAARRERGYVAIDAPHSNGNYTPQSLPSPRPPALYAQQVIQHDVSRKETAPLGVP